MYIVETLRSFYRVVFKENYSPVVGGILLALLVVLLEIWYRPWGVVGGLRNWGEWVLFGIGFLKEEPPHPLWLSSSVMNIGFFSGVFISACLAKEFGIRIPPKIEIIKGVVAGVLMGIGSALAMGCNIGGFYMSFANLSASGVSMMLGLIIGVFIGVKYLLWEVERFSSQGGYEITPRTLSPILGLLALVFLLWGAYTYSNNERAEAQFLGGTLLLSAGIDFVMHRTRFCIVRAFREFLSQVRPPWLRV